MANPNLRKQSAKPLPGGPGFEETTPSATASNKDLDRIREILFGRQSQAFEIRLQNLESLTREETTALRSDTAKRLASLELYVKGEINALTERLRAESEERTRGLRQVSRELRDGLEAIEKRLTTAGSQTEEELRLLREQVLHDSQSLRDEIHASAESAGPPAGTLPH